MISPKNIKSHTGLRAIAAFSVFMFHLYEQEAANWGLSSGMFKPFQWGGPAVDLFFMLSGFILNHVYLNRSASVHWREYFIARFARIAPLYYATLLITPHRLGVFASVLWNFPRYALWWGWGFVAVILANLLMISGLISGIRYIVNPPSWSISVEMFLYIAIFPILAKKALGMPRWLMVGVCAVLGILLFSCHDHALLHLPPKISGGHGCFLDAGFSGSRLVFSFARCYAPLERPLLVGNSGVGF